VAVSPFVRGSPPNPAITPPASGFSVQGGNYNLGVVFTANNNLAVDGLGFFDTVGNTPHDQWVGLYDSGQNLIASALVLHTGATTSGYFWQNITPVTLTSGQTYTVDTAYDGTNLNSYIYSAVNIPSFNSQVTFGGTTFAGGGPSLVFPSSVDGGAPFYYGPNFSIAASIPEPATCATLLGLGGLGFAAWRQRR